MKEQVKELVGPRGVRFMRRIGRVRYDRKLWNLRHEGLGIRNAPLAYVRYLPFDPELHSYSFELANRDELARFSAGLLSISESHALGLIAEADEDPELGRELSRRVRWRLDYKRRVPLGTRLPEGGDHSESTETSTGEEHDASP